MIREIASPPQPAVDTRGLRYAGNRPDHRAFLEAVCAASARLRWLGTANSGFRAAVEIPRPDIVVIDWRSAKPLSSCLAARRALPAAAIFLLLHGEDDIHPDLWPELASTTTGVLTCATQPATMAGTLAVSTEAAEALEAVRRRLPAAPPPVALTDLEEAVLSHAADGRTAAETARKLGVSSADVQSVLRGLKKRLGARSRAHAVALALRAGHLAGPRPLP
ncbi:helix-turn-helix transcriptional regulator [Amycolatopsis rhizosphaerae]|uniref:Helix-turn-helix transcriptional regulator n=2 Tax=Amycolatopsis rhizosphaerae TaxID=2053003 RepID=A0A558DAV9_9PSEU|nr:helix-turn-helix transcriptional regulator [Amycolatopsis rhizosphaerae]